MEYFDILKQDGSISGKIAPKGTELLEDEYYLGVHAYIHNSKGEFLLQKRSMKKEFLPGGWDIHMGHVMAGETSKIAIKREIKEELGIEVNNLKFLKQIVWEKHNHFIDMYISCKDIDLSDLILQKSEVEDVKYVPRDEMIDLIRSMDYRPKEYRDVIENYVREISSV
ncbi:NUDIX domain-containing protein [Dethiothermospora halolimnae]|uniref:NUDIX domain-containing protein n=1 Tax=Dethiothermospora halolimnae TaxID=3114390 RepID=UPI003CCB9386